MAGGEGVESADETKILTGVHFVSMMADASIISLIPPQDRAGLPINDAAVYLGIGRSTIYTLINEGAIEALAKAEAAPAPDPLNRANGHVPDIFDDLEALKVGQNFIKAGSAPTLLRQVPVRRPKTTDWFRVCPPEIPPNIVPHRRQR
jgi:predicted DNA-binding transcriptional regulator AlpA